MLRDATLTTRYRYVDHQRSTQINVTTFVSQASTHLAATQISLTPDFDGLRHEKWRNVVGFGIRFFIPQLGSQVYAMAGMQTELNLIADAPGRFVGRNTQYSGRGFSDDPSYKGNC